MWSTEGKKQTSVTAYNNEMTKIHMNSNSESKIKSDS